MHWVVPLLSWFRSYCRCTRKYVVFIFHWPWLEIHLSVWWKILIIHTSYVHTYSFKIPCNEGSVWVSVCLCVCVCVYVLQACWHVWGICLYVHVRVCVCMYVCVCLLVCMFGCVLFASAHLFTWFSQIDSVHLWNNAAGGLWCLLVNSKTIELLMSLCLQTGQNIVQAAKEQKGLSQTSEKCLLVVPVSPVGHQGICIHEGAICVRGWCEKYMCVCYKWARERERENDHMISM